MLPQSEGTNLRAHCVPAQLSVCPVVHPTIPGADSLKGRDNNYVYATVLHEFMETRNETSPCYEITQLIVLLVVSCLMGNVYLNNI